MNSTIMDHPQVLGVRDDLAAFCVILMRNEKRDFRAGIGMENYRGAVKSRPRPGLGHYPGLTTGDSPILKKRRETRMKAVMRMTKMMRA